ncbi:MAG: alpha/beta hydrolase [Smithellaceae bacterium]
MAVRFRVENFMELDADIYGDWSGQPVVLLHGGGQTRYAWGSTTETLSKAGFLVINLDLRGHGHSAWAPDGNYSIDAYANDLRSVVNLLGRPVALVGASLGGLTSLIAVGEVPRTPCSALILVDIAPRIELDGRDRIIEFMCSRPDGFSSLEEAADTVAQFLPHRPRPTDTSGLAKNLRLGPDGRYHWHWDPAFMEGRIGDESYNPERFEQAARAIEAPMMLVRGRMSEIVSEEGAKAFRQIVPGAEYIDVQEAAHMVAGDRNDVFTEAILSFLCRKLA